MKKRLALLVGVLIILSTIFAACSQAAATERITRWDNSTGETHTFAITLADFSNEEGVLFNTYYKTVINDKGTEQIANCYKDNSVSTTEIAAISGGDEICPLDASGTFTMNIQKDPTTTTLTTTQTIFSQYQTSKLTELECLDKLSDYDVTTSAENPFTNNEGRTTLRSTTTATVVFANDANQLPQSSVKENVGYYIGALHQGPSNYKYETTYDFDNNKVTVKKDDGEAVERKLSGKCIDAAQFILYVRSFDKSSAAFASNPSVSVYDATTNTMCSASFAITREVNTILSNGESESVVTLDLITATVDGFPFMAQHSLPDLSKAGEDGKGYDYLQLSGDRRCKFTTVKFRSGWYSYELQPNDEYQQIIDAVKLQVVA